MVVLAVDPGSKKSGIAVVCSERGILRHLIVKVEELGDNCAALAREFNFDEVIVGGSTGSKQAQNVLSSRLGREVKVVDERFTTERAKKRYFEVNPPKGWRRLLPSGLLYPPCPFDDFAAVVMAEDFIKAKGAEIQE